MRAADAQGMLAAGAPGMVATGRNMVQSSLSNTDNPFKRKDRILIFCRDPAHISSEGNTKHEA